MQTKCIVLVGGNTLLRYRHQLKRCGWIILTTLNIEMCQSTPDKLWKVKLESLFSGKSDPLIGLTKLEIQLSDFCYFSKHWKGQTQYNLIVTSTSYKTCLLFVMFLAAE